MQDNQSSSDRIGKVVTGLASAEIAKALERLQIGKYHTKGGHGFAAEDANARNDALRLRNVEITGNANKINGPDRIVDGTPIQTKYFQTPDATINAAFDNTTGLYRYQGQVLEVPADQYDECVEIFQRKIAEGKVPGINDPNEAKDIVRKGYVTYKQARNIARAGNVDSLLFDVQTQSITSTYIFGISFTIDFACRIWHGDKPEEAIQSALQNGIIAGSRTLVSGVISAQVLRTRMAAAGAVALRSGVNKVASTDLGRTLVHRIASASLGRPVYGAAAVNHVAKLLRTNAITSTISLVALTAPDMYRAAIRRDMSWSQVAKNMAVNGASIVAGSGGWFAGAAAGATIGSVIPGVGTAIGGVVGGICGGVLGGFAGASGANKVLDRLIEDDASKMIHLLQSAIEELASDYLLSERECAELMTEVRKTISDTWLKDMYRSGSSDDSNLTRKRFAYNSFEHICQQITSRRSRITMPDPDQVLNCAACIAEVYTTQDDSIAQEASNVSP
ncbi:MAG: hypothetical protein C0183_08545 [Roseiflexus castenholzii]|uniref:hypothetical protein n=1 Tax=Roseiflexus castenholzii TaxID=120962 RepID=UPI000CB727BA|nr:MAG: hypothetical protein C0183_08545 [Roseiflexus castenholzii]